MLRRPPLPRTVLALGLVSLLTDVSSEMIYPLLPVFLATTIGAGAMTVGLIEGAAESTAGLLKLASGWWSDRLRRRKPLVVVGYALASAVRPFVALATAPWHVLTVRLLDRVGKGIRTAPRDALIADVVDPDSRGRAFGLHRAADHLGAVIGPLIAFALLTWAGFGMREVFLAAAIPAILAVVALVVLVREAPRPVPPSVAPSPTESAESPTPMLAAPAHAMGRPFWSFVAVVLLFTLGNSTDAFLLLRAGELGVPVAMLPLLWAALHVVKSVANLGGGELSDRLGRRPTIVAGWLVYALVYGGFAIATQPGHAWALFLAYGVFYGLTEGSERAFVADLVPAARRGAAFGWYNLALAAGSLPAALIFGFLWDRAGGDVAFFGGAAAALAAAVLLAGLVRPAREITA